MSVVRTRLPHGGMQFSSLQAYSMQWFAGQCFGRGGVLESLLATHVSRERKKTNDFPTFLNDRKISRAAQASRPT